jgi:hypothetical protein
LRYLTREEAMMLVRTQQGIYLNRQLARDIKAGISKEVLRRIDKKIEAAIRAA